MKSGDYERNKHIIIIIIINHPPTNTTTPSQPTLSFIRFARVERTVGIHYTHIITIIIIHVVMELIQIMRNTYYPENNVREIEAATVRSAA